jgi:hypothetical protein
MHATCRGLCVGQGWRQGRLDPCELQLAMKLVAIDERIEGESDRIIARAQLQAHASTPFVCVPGSAMPYQRVAVHWRGGRRRRCGDEGSCHDEHGHRGWHGLLDDFSAMQDLNRTG